ncbi:hypothetical protein [Novosphingobium sp.]|uniref:hypothetical protein n=1 Tax=Novosphingobium sp. TaxID=1874826 RepID=UPI00286E10E1|nr:hypothetical protein [Novosphingobium sp.]
MSETPPKVDLARDARNSARNRLLGRFSSLKGDYAEKGLGERVGERITGKVKGAAHDLGEVANDSKGVIAGAGALLGLWLARRPILSLGGRWWSKLKARMDKEF